MPTQIMCLRQRLKSFEAKLSEYETLQLTIQAQNPRYGCMFLKSSPIYFTLPMTEQQGIEPASIGSCIAIVIIDMSLLVSENSPLPFRALGCTAASRWIGPKHAQSHFCEVPSNGKVGLTFLGEVRIRRRRRPTMR